VRQAVSNKHHFQGLVKGRYKPPLPALMLSGLDRTLGGAACVTFRREKSNLMASSAAASRCRRCDTERHHFHTTSISPPYRLHTFFTEGTEDMPERLSTTSRRSYCVIKTSVRSPRAKPLVSHGTSSGWFACTASELAAGAVTCELAGWAGCGKIAVCPFACST
jgi:hypothetical protein